MRDNPGTTTVVANIKTNQRPCNLIPYFKIISLDVSRKIIERFIEVCKQYLKGHKSPVRKFNFQNTPLHCIT